MIIGLAAPWSAGPVPPPLTWLDATPLAIVTLK